MADQGTCIFTTHCGYAKTVPIVGAEGAKFHTYVQEAQDSCSDQDGWNVGVLSSVSRNMAPCLSAAFSRILSRSIKLYIVFDIE